MKSFIYDIIATAGTIESTGTKLLKPFGLTPMTFNILNLLKAGPLSQREISERIIVAASSITFQVRQLQKKGLIQRRRTNARTWGVSLTTLGSETQLLAEHRMDEAMAQVQISPELMASAASALMAVRNYLPNVTQAATQP